LCRQHFSDRAADAAGSAGDDRDAAGQAAITRHVAVRLPQLSGQGAASYNTAKKSLIGWSASLSGERRGSAESLALLRSDHHFFFVTSCFRGCILSPFNAVILAARR
jgi:hypothetical protein